MEPTLCIIRKHPKYIYIIQLCTHFNSIESLYLKSFFKLLYTFNGSSKRSSVFGKELTFWLEQVDTIIERCTISTRAIRQ